MSKYLYNIFWIIFISMLQISFLSTWPAPVDGVNLILCLIIFLTLTTSYRQGLYWAFGGGLFLELFSGLPFGIIAVSLMATIIIVNLLFNNFFTNRSLYSLVILGFAGSVIYNLMIYGLTIVSLFLNLTSAPGSFIFWSKIFWQPAFNVIILCIIFLAYYTFTSRFKSMFLYSYETKGRL